MSVDRSLDEIVTKFFLDTCRSHRLLSKHAVQAASNCAEAAAKHLENDKEANFIPLITGSAAEFYIEPMFPHVGDIDVMYYPSNMLAIHRGQSPPTQLPQEFHNYVHV